jgi:DNA invertase Pin-like site-specific DNA recombinase
MKKVIGYCRVSTEDQSVHGHSLPAQEQKIRQYADLYGMQISEIVTDAGISAKNFNRPGIQSILTMIRKKEVQAIIVAKLDRLTRNVRDLADIVELCNKTDTALISVNEHIDTGTAAGRMILNMLGVISQWEREAIGERTSASLQYKKQSGKKYNCNAIYGYTEQDGNLIPDETEQNNITLMIHLRDQGLSFKVIAERLNSINIQSRSGNNWHSEQVRRVILNTEDRKNINGNLHNKAIA